MPQETWFIQFGCKGSSQPGAEVYRYILRGGARARLPVENPQHTHRAFWGFMYIRIYSIVESRRGNFHLVNYQWSYTLTPPPHSLYTPEFDAGRKLEDSRGRMYRRYKLSRPPPPLCVGIYDEGLGQLRAAAAYPHLMYIYNALSEYLHSTDECDK